MVPKFRGGSDDWMDDERASSGAKGGPKPKKNASAKATYLPPEEANAVVTEVFPNQCRVKLDALEPGLPPEFLCSYRRAGVVGQADSEYRERTPVAVGDRVLATRSSPDSGVIESVCERRNRLIRPAPGRDNKKILHVLAANVDTVVIVASLKEPEFSPGLIDRFLIGAQAGGITPLICVTKIDLHQPHEEKPWDVYANLGWEVLQLSVRTGAGLAELRSHLIGKTVVFCGRSGAGKTSLLRTLLESDIGRIGEVSQATGKGKHTTTSAIMLGGPEESQWIDTPGVREFGLSEIKPEKLSEFFPELQGLKCAIANCQHGSEEGCEAVGLPRYSSYLRILESLRNGEG